LTEFALGGKDRSEALKTGILIARRFAEIVEVTIKALRRASLVGGRPNPVGIKLPGKNGTDLSGFL
jgi:hypothetical protein